MNLNLKTNNLLKIKDWVYILNLDEYQPIGTHWITLYVNDDNSSAFYDATYFDSFGAKHIPKETKI